MTKKTTKEKVEDTLNEIILGSPSQQTIQPMGDRVLVLPDISEEKKTTSGFILPDQGGNIIGTVVAIGPGKTENGEFVPVNLTYGDRVVLGQYGHEKVAFEGKNYYMVSEASILAIIN